MSTAEMNDVMLLERWRSGENSAGSVLVKRHFNALYRFFTNKAFGHEDDLVQQTFMACVEARDALRDDEGFRSFLFGIARHKLLTHYRRLHRATQIDFTQRSVLDIGTSPSGAVLRNEEARLLQSALQRIALDQQIALELCYWEGLSTPEIASVLEVPENTVYSRLRRAKARLRAALLELAESPEAHNGAWDLLTRGGGST